MSTHSQYYILLLCCKLQYSNAGTERDVVHTTALFIRFGFIENERVGSLLSVSNNPGEDQELKELLTVAVESIVKEVVIEYTQNFKFLLTVLRA